MDAVEYHRLIRKQPELAPFFEWVRPGKDGRRGFYRVIPYVRFKPKVNQLRTMLNFGEAAHEAYGKKGFRVVEGRLLPVVAAEVKRKVKGKKVKGKDLKVLEKLTRLQKILEAVAT